MSRNVCLFSSTHPSGTLLKNYLMSNLVLAGFVGLICAVASKVLKSNPKADALMGTCSILLLNTLQLVDHQISKDKNTHATSHKVTWIFLTILLSYSIRHFANLRGYQISVLIPALGPASIVALGKFDDYMQRSQKSS